MTHRSFYPFAKPLNEQLQALKNRMQAHLPCIDRVSFAKYHPQQDMLKSFADTEFDNWDLAHFEAPLRKLPHLYAASQSGTPRVVDDLYEIDQNSRVKTLLKHGYRSSVAIPCYENKEFSGFVFLNSVQPGSFKLETLNSLKPYIDMVEFAVESEDHVVHEIERQLDRKHSMMAGYCPECYAHAKRMRLYAQLIAAKIAERHQLTDEIVEQIGIFAQFHAVSDARLPIDIACYRTHFSKEQEEVLVQHIEQCIESARDIVANIGSPVHPSVELFMQIVSYQYENLNGSGYPCGLEEQDIPIAAQIVAVANSFDVLTTHHPHRQAWSIPYALIELEKWVQEGLLSGECVNVLREHQVYLKQIILKYPEHCTNSV